MNLVFSTRLPRIGLAALALVGVAFAAPRFANAEVFDNNITIALPTIELTAAQGAAGTSGYFDITVTDSATESIAQLGANFEMTGPGITYLGNSNAVQFVGADYGQLTNGANADPGNNQYQAAQPDGIGDAAGASPDLLYPYAYGNVYATQNSSDVTNGSYAYSDTTDAHNSDLTNSGKVTLTAGTTYSFEQVYYTVAPGTGPGTYTLTLDVDAPYNSTANPTGSHISDYVNLLSDTSTNSNDGTLFTNGAIVIQAPVVPEPSSIVLMVLGAIGLFGFGLRRFRRA